MTMIIVEGYPGAGKTTLAVKKALQHAKRKKRKVICNFPVHHPDVEFGDWEDMRRVTDSICIMDEASRWFGSRAWSKTSEEELEVFKHSRHYRNTIYFLCQDHTQLDVELRSRLAQYVWRVKRLFGPDEDEEETPLEKRIGVWSICTKYHALGYGSERRQFVLERDKLRLNDYWHLFDTHYIVGKKGARADRPDPQAAGADGTMPALDRERYLRCTNALTWAGLTLWQPPLDDALDLRMGLRTNAQTSNDLQDRRFLRPGGPIC